MFDDLETTERKSEDEQRPSDDQETPSSGLAGWIHIIALAAFCLLYFPLRRHPWSIYVGVAAAYTIFVFELAIGGNIQDLDDFFGDSRVARCAAMLLVPHLFMLTLIVLGVFLWLHLRPLLPLWVTQEGRKGSFWDLCGWPMLVLAGIAQGIWMAGKLKRRLSETEKQA